MTKYLATDGHPTEAGEVTRYRTLARAIIERALLDLYEKGWVREDAERWLFDDEWPALVEYRRWLFDLADLHLDRLRRFLRSTDTQTARKFADRLVQVVSEISGG